jgi:hypothetical protein
MAVAILPTYNSRGGAALRIIIASQARAAAADASAAATATDTLNHPIIRCSPRSPKKQESTTAVLPPAANVSVKAVAAVQPPSSAEAYASV